MGERVQQPPDGTQRKRTASASTAAAKTRRYAPAPRMQPSAYKSLLIISAEMALTIKRPTVDMTPMAWCLSSTLSTAVASIMSHQPMANWRGYRGHGLEGTRLRCRCTDAKMEDGGRSNQRRSAALFSLLLFQTDAFGRLLSLSRDKWPAAHCLQGAACVPGSAPPARQRRKRARESRATVRLPSFGSLFSLPLSRSPLAHDIPGRPQRQTTADCGSLGATRSRTRKSQSLHKEERERERGEGMRCGLRTAPLLQMESLQMESGVEEHGFCDARDGEWFR